MKLHHLRNVVVLLVVIVLFLLSVEIVIRLIYKDVDLVSGWTSHDEYIPHAELIYSGVKSRKYEAQTDEFIERGTTNTQGFRDKEITIKAPNTYRMLVIGDSFTFGHGISSNDNTYPKKLESYLKNIEGPTKTKFEVFNLGVKGYSPDQEYRLITTKLASYEPDLIIWTLSNPGDLFNLIQASGWPVPALYDIKNNTLIPKDARFNWLYAGKFLKLNTPPFIHNSFIFNLGFYFLSQTRFSNQKPYLSNKDLLDWAADKLLLEINNVEKILRKKSIPLVVVVLPYPEIFLNQTTPKEVAKKFSSLLTELKTNKIEIIDVFEEMSPNEKTKWKQYYFTIDNHPNDQGAAFFASIVGNRIFKFLQLH